MSIEAATARIGRVTARSASGTVLCLERASDGSLSYGSAPGEGDEDQSAFAGAIAA